jgi:hypothetical protein
VTPSPSLFQTGPTKFTADVLKIIGERENQFQNSIKDAFARLQESALRSLRMALPRSKTKINWDVFQVQGMSSTGGGAT